MRPAILAVTFALLFGPSLGRAVAQEGLEGSVTPAAPPAAAPSGPQVDIANRFYTAFCSHDFDTMESLYDPDVKWKDTLTSFDSRSGTMGMWRALAAQDPSAKFSYRIVSAQGDQVVVNWLADYHLFGNPVHNDVEATLVIKNGLIVQHTDVYSWDKWASQVFPSLAGVVAEPAVEDTLQGALGAALHAESALANAKHDAQLAAEAVSKDEKGLIQKLEGAAGK